MSIIESARKAAKREESTSTIESARKAVEKKTETVGSTPSSRGGAMSGNIENKPATPVSTSISTGSKFNPAKAAREDKYASATIKGAPTSENKPAYEAKPATVVDDSRKIENKAQREDKYATENIKGDNSGLFDKLYPDASDMQRRDYYFKRVYGENGEKLDALPDTPGNRDLKLAAKYMVPSQMDVPELITAVERSDDDKNTAYLNKVKADKFYPYAQGLSYEELEEEIKNKGKKYTNNEVKILNNEKYYRDYEIPFMLLDKEVQEKVISTGQYAMVETANNTAMAMAGAFADTSAIAWSADQTAQNAKKQDEMRQELIDLGYTAKQVSEFLKIGERIYNDRLTTKKQENIENASGLELTGYNILSWFEPAVAWIGMTDLNSQNLSNKLGPYRPVDYNTINLLGTNMARTTTQTTADRINNPVGNFFYDAANMIADIGVASLYGPAANFFLSSSGALNETLSAHEAGASDVDAINYGNMVFASTYITESMFGGIGGFGTGFLDDIGASIFKGLRNPILRGGLKAVGTIGGEIVEEEIQYLLEVGAQKITYDPNATVNLGEMTYTGLLSAVVSLPGGTFKGIQGAKEAKMTKATYDTVQSIIDTANKATTPTEARQAMLFMDTTVKYANKVMSDYKKYPISTFAKMYGVSEEGAKALYNDAELMASLLTDAETVYAKEQYNIIYDNADGTIASEREKAAMFNIATLVRTGNKTAAMDAIAAEISSNEQAMDAIAALGSMPDEEKTKMITLLTERNNAWKSVSAIVDNDGADGITGLLEANYGEDGIKYAQAEPKTPDNSADSASNSTSASSGSEFNEGKAAREDARASYSVRGTDKPVVNTPATAPASQFNPTKAEREDARAAKDIRGTDNAVNDVEDDTTPDAIKTAENAVKTAETEASSVPLAERLDAMSEKNEAISVEDAKKATGFGDNGAKMVADLANTDGVTFSQAKSTVEVAYLAGFSDVDSSKVSFVTDTQIDAFTAGKLDRMMQDTTAKAEAANATVYNRGVVENDEFNKLSAADKKQHRQIAKDLGLRAEFVERILYNNNGKIVEANAQHQDGIYKRSSDSKNAPYEDIIHESFHRMKQAAPVETGLLINELVEHAEEFGRRIELGDTRSGTVFDKVKSEHDAANISLDTLDVLEEIGAREITKFFQSAKEWNAWRARLDANSQLQKVWYKFIDFIKELFDKLKRYVSQMNMTAEQKAKANKAIAERERILSLYANAYTAAKNAVDAKRASGDVKAEKNTDTMDGVDFSLKDSKEHVKKRFYSQLDNWDGETIGFSFVLGTTSEALKKAGVPDKQIRWDASKIKKLLKDHEGMDIDVVKQIPDLLDNPVVVIDSKQNLDSRIVMGDLYDNNHKLVTVVLLLTPTSKKGNKLDLIKVSSAQGRSHIESLFRYEDGSMVNVRFVDKKRIHSWLNVNRLQLPLHSFNSDSTNSIAQKTKVVNTQNSLKSTENTTSADTKKLLDTIEHLKHEFERTEFAKADPKKLASMAKSLLKDYASQADSDEVTKAIDELYQYMANGADGQVAVWSEVYDKAYDIAENIVENALVLDDADYREYSNLRNYLRTTAMKFDAKYDDVPSSYESFNEFRKKNMGRLKFTNDGAGIDSVYMELAEVYPEFFDAEEQISTGDMLERIVEVLDSLRPLEVNPFSNDIKQASSHLASDIINRFFDIPQAKPTFADKADSRVTNARIAGQKKVDRVREQRDAKIQKLIESQREKTKKLIEKAKEARSEAVKKEKAKREKTVSRMRESQKAKVLRARIIRHISQLSKTLRKATDKKHIPKELTEAVNALLYNINLESNYTYELKDDYVYNEDTGSFEEVTIRSYHKNDNGIPVSRTQAYLHLKEIYKNIAKNNEYNLTLAPELIGDTSEGVENIFDEIMRLSDKRIADMTSVELTTVYKAIRIIEHSIATANKTFAIQKWETLSDTAKAFEKSVATRRPKRALTKHHYLLDIETPLTFFSHFGEAGLELYQALREAQDNEQVMIDELAERINGIVSLEEVQNAEKKVYEITTQEGKKLVLSKSHIMDIYLLYNREQGKKHLLYDPDSGYNGEGIHQPEVKNKKIRRSAEITRLTKNDIHNIISKLDEADKKIADKLQETTSLLAEWGNKASLEVFGYEKFNDPDYWTVKSAREGLYQTVERKIKDMARSIKNIGSAKPTEETATNALDIFGAFELFNQHASDMICYSAWLGVMEDATKLHNYTFRDADGNKTTLNNFKVMLEKYAGEGGEKYYSNLLKDIQNGVSTAPDTSTEGLYTKLYGLASKAKVAYKTTVVLQQPMSIVKAAMVLNPSSIMQALAKGGLNLPVWAGSKPKKFFIKGGVKTSEWYGGWERAVKYSPIAARKAIGGYDVASSSSGLREVVYRPQTKKGKVVDSIKESPLWAAGKADEIAWGIMWNACEIEISQKKTFEKDSDAYYEAVKKLFDKIINETQVVDGVLQRSQMMRSSSGWIKPMTTFKGEPTITLNMVIRAYDSLRYENDPAKRGKAIKNFGKTIVVFLATAALTAFARSLAVGLTGEDDDEYWEKVWKSFSGIQGDEDAWFDYVLNIGLKSDVVNNINPLSWLPITSEIISGLQGYNVDRLDSASITDFVKTGIYFIDSLDDENKYKVGYQARNVFLKAAEFTGYSPFNIIRDIEGAIRTIRYETNDVKGLYNMEKWRTKPAANISKYANILHKAYTTDKESYEFIYKDLVSICKADILKKGVELTEEDKARGKTKEIIAQEKAEAKIQSAMEARIKKDAGVTKASELSKRYMSPDDESKYDNGLKKIEKTDVWKSANSEQRKGAKADLYSFITSTSEEMEKLRKEATASGVDATEYVLWQLASEMVDEANDDNNSLNAKEKAEAIEMLTLGNSEIAYFYGTEQAEEAYKHGIDMTNYALFKASVSGLEGDNKEAKVKAYAKQYSDTRKEYLYFMGTVYSSWKERGEYIKYFG